MKEFVQYKRDKNGVPIGCVVGHVMPSTGEVYYGWSLCHKSDRKQLSKKFAKQVARARVHREVLLQIHPNENTKPIMLPFSLESVHKSLAARIGHYKEKNGL